MSAADDTAMLSATDTDTVAADWLQRRHFWTWREEDQKALDAWLALSPAHEIAYWRLEAAWNDTQRIAALQRPVMHRSPVRSWQRFAAIAVGGAIVVAAGLGWPSFLDRPETHLVITGLGERKTVTLADGSKVELNTNSTLRIVANAEGRKAWLDRGEAFFDIVHDSRHPFIVTVGNRRITDLGTKFLVRRDHDKLSVALVEGSARFDAPDGSVMSPVFLKPGDVLQDKGHAIIATRKTSVEMKDELGWRRGLLVFKHATLADAAAEFNRYNANKVVIADPQTARIAIGGTFQSNNVSVFAEAVRDLLGLRVQTGKSETVISR
jgi:transmembrane sensor